MADTKTIQPEQDRANPVVELRIRATPDQLPVLRALAAAIAVHEDFDVDSIADIRLAMDEICTYLITRSTEDAVLVCRLQYVDRTLSVAVSTTTVDAEYPNTRSFGWHVLDALTDSVDTRQEPDPAGYLTTLEFTKTNGTYS
ncbi:ATP-binding protein [Rhodococcus rhodnii]|uniref:Anti-sigma factor n=2 Tax=Rhodococcus rhodnii TaxID=38312 RepID=R7WRV4_9NOCA|nr:ATP-binding protein [Rhodococcus rhodnii]EOM76684.1 anti-sigma factor [Rhodococcus rhodnii LMG 5362]TXG92007.1 ATP-binding protein [Rhodococcus rhodnii]